VPVGFVVVAVPCGPELDTFAPALAFGELVPPVGVGVGDPYTNVEMEVPTTTISSPAESVLRLSTVGGFPVPSVMGTPFGERVCVPMMYTPFVGVNVCVPTVIAGRDC
jgi:hypothetical protein